MTERGGTLLITLHQRLGESAFTPFAGAAPLVHCLRSMLETSHAFGAVVVAASASHAAEARSMLAAQDIGGVRLAVATGDGSRADCLRAGIDAAPRNSEYIVLHDVSRPLASSPVRNRVVDAVVRGHAFVIPTLVVIDSVKAVDHSGTVVRTVDRSLLRSAQFPRGFGSNTLRHMLESVTAAEPFDEVRCAVNLGYDITTVDGDSDAFEIRGLRDTALAEAIVARRVAGAL